MNLALGKGQGWKVSTGTLDRGEYVERHGAVKKHDYMRTCG